MSAFRSGLEADRVRKMNTLIPVFKAVCDGKRGKFLMKL